MQSKSTLPWPMQSADDALASAASNASESSQWESPTGANPSEQQTPAPRITPAHLAEPSAEGQDSLTAAWAAVVRKEELALPEQLRPLRHEHTSVTSVSAEKATAMQVEAEARNPEEKSDAKVLSDRQAVTLFVNFWRVRRGDCYLVVALVFVTMAIQWAIWSK